MIWTSSFMLTLRTLISLETWVLRLRSCISFFFGFMVSDASLRRHRFVELLCSAPSEGPLSQLTLVARLGSTTYDQTVVGPAYHPFSCTIEAWNSGS